MSLSYCIENLLIKMVYKSNKIKYNNTDSLKLIE